MSQIFTEWKNNLEGEHGKLHEIKKTIEKIEFKGQQKIKKEVEVRAFLLKHKVTKGFLERQKIKPFGIGKTEDDLRQNVNLTSIQRENVWHPFYETKLEEEDLKEKFQRSKAEKKEKAQFNQEIEEIETKLKTLQEQEREEERAASEAASGVKKYDFRKTLERKKLEDAEIQAKPVEDMQTVKLRNLSNDITEDEIYDVMQKFGEIIKVKIPMEEMMGGRMAGKFRNKGFAFVSFKNPASADRALEQGEVNVEFATLEIERAMKRVGPPRDFQNPINKEAFGNLTRSKN